jgi:hypothetical protein
LVAWRLSGLCPHLLRFFPAARQQCAYGLDDASELTLPTNTGSWPFDFSLTIGVRNTKVWLRRPRSHTHALP